VLGANSFRGLLHTLIPAGEEAFSKRMLILSRLTYLLLLIAAVAAVFWALRSADAESWVRHSIEVRGEARMLTATVQDAIIRERGLLLTGEVRHLGDYPALMDSLDKRFAALREWVADNPAQQQRLAELHPLVAALKDVLRDTIDLTRSGRRDDALKIVRSNRVLDLSAQINAKLASFIAAEESLLGERQANAAWLQSALLYLIAGSLLIAVAMAVILESATRRFIGKLRAHSKELEAEIKRRLETEETLRQAHKMEAIGQLTGGIAHDFNNLLTVMIGNLDMLRRQLGRFNPAQTIGEVTGTIQKHVDIATQAARNAAKLTHRLLAFARRQPLEPARLDCNKLISGMSDLLRRTLGETVNLEIVLGGGLWPTFADPNQLENALLNLAVNARHAMPEGGQLTIETANAYLDEAYVRRFGDLQAGQYVQISVADTGTGIAPDVLERVFEPFFTTKKGEVGSGLGLAMVHGFVKQTGGHVRIYSEVGHGTTVKVYLPRLRADEGVAAMPAPVAEAPPQDVRAVPGETILVVEDNDGVREYARAVLEELGYKVFEAVTAADAMRFVEEGARIDLLFTDVVLPGGASGRQLADSMVLLRPDLPVLFTTGYTRNAIVHHGRLDPDVQLLNKPYTQQDLARKVRELITRRLKSTS
jgi:signal transduction histidine kinase